MFPNMSKCWLSRL